MLIPSGSTCALDKLYAVYGWKTKSSVLKLYQESKLAFLTTCLSGNCYQMSTAQENFNLSEKKVLSVLRSTWKKALNLQNTRSFENQVFVCDC